MPELRPQSPFAAWPSHKRFEGLGFGWVIHSPRAIVTQLQVEAATVEVAHRIQDWFDELVDSGFVSRERRVVILHDWRSMKRVEAGVRAAWLERAKRPNDPFYEAVGYAAVSLTSMSKLAANTIALAVQLINHSTLTFVDDPREVLEKHNLAVPKDDELRRALTGSLKS